MIDILFRMYYVQENIYLVVKMKQSYRTSFSNRPYYNKSLKRSDNWTKCSDEVQKVQNIAKFVERLSSYENGPKSGKIIEGSDRRQRANQITN